ncbi:MAG: c-type cytochrome, partial [Acidimicrobiales bacterium]
MRTKTRYALPGAVVALTLGAGLVLFSGSSAQATSPSLYPPATSTTLVGSTSPSPAPGLVPTADSTVVGGAAPPTPTDPQLRLGQTLFVSNCSSCHGLGASG